MPKMSDRERLSDLELRHRRMSEEIVEVRRSLRGKFAAIILDLPVETMTEKEFRALLTHAIRVGVATAIAALAPIQAK
jgi:hypothetical protein